MFRFHLADVLKAPRFQTQPVKNNPQGCHLPQSFIAWFNVFVKVGKITASSSRTRSGFPLWRHWRHACRCEAQQPRSPGDILIFLALYLRQKVAGFTYIVTYKISDWEVQNWWILNIVESVFQDQPESIRMEPKPRFEQLQIYPQPQHFSKQAQTPMEHICQSLGAPGLHHILRCDLRLAPIHRRQPLQLQPRRVPGAAALQCLQAVRATLQVDDHGSQTSQARGGRSWSRRLGSGLPLLHGLLDYLLFHHHRLLENQEDARKLEPSTFRSAIQSRSKYSKHQVQVTTCSFLPFMGFNPCRNFSSSIYSDSLSNCLPQAIINCSSYLAKDPAWYTCLFPNASSSLSWIHRNWILFG